jgi:two-component system, LytTR family, sensor kinase
MTLSLRDRRTFWILQAAGWTAFALVHSVAGLGKKEALTVFLVNATFAAAGFAASLPAWVLYRRVPRIGIAAIPLVIAGSSVGAVVWYLADHLFQRLTGVLPWDAPFLHPNAGPLHFILLTLGAFLLAWSALYFALVHARQLDRERQRAIASQALAREAQLRALRYQLSPHFLFNVLNAISTLVAEGQSSRAVAMIARLGEFLRATLDDQIAEVTLERELTLVDTYLEIERARFGSRLHVSIEADAEVLDATVPTLLLQPLVENAVRHGISRRPESGRVTVGAERRGDRLCLTVEDTGPGWSAERPQLGVGLRNAKERLDHLFGEDYVLQFGDRPGGGAEIRIELPLRHASSGAAAAPLQARPAPAAASPAAGRNHSIE